MKYFTIPSWSRCEFEIYDHTGSLCEVLRDFNVVELSFNESEFIEERNIVGSEGTFMRFSRKGQSPMTEGDFYQCVVIDTENVIVENR